MIEKDLERKINEVILLLENEIKTRDRGVGVYKELLRIYTESLEECRKGNLLGVRIKGTLRILYDNLANGNEELEKKMDEAIGLLASIVLIK